MCAATCSTSPELCRESVSKFKPLNISGKIERSNIIETEPANYSLHYIWIHVWSIFNNKNFYRYVTFFLSKNNTSTPSTTRCHDHPTPDQFCPYSHSVYYWTGGKNPPIQYNPGFLFYHTSVWDDNSNRVGILCGVFAAGMVLLVVFLVWCSKGDKEKKKDDENDIEMRKATLLI